MDTKKKASSKKHPGPKAAAPKVVPKKSATAKPVAKGGTKSKKPDFDSESDLGKDNFFINQQGFLIKNNSVASIL